MGVTNVANTPQLGTRRVDRGPVAVGPIAPADPGLLRFITNRDELAKAKVFNVFCWLIAERCDLPTQVVSDVLYLIVAVARTRHVLAIRLCPKCFV